MNKRHYIILLIMTLIIVTLIAAYRPLPKMATLSTNLPDAIMEDVIMMVFDKTGRLKLKISTPNMVHYLENDATDLKIPEIILFRNTSLPWRITAEHAKAFEGTDKVELQENVIIQHAGDQNIPSTVIKTSSLTFHSEPQTVETNDPITLIQPNIIIKSVGMFADIESGNIKLLSKAVGEYVPDKK